MDSRSISKLAEGTSVETEHGPRISRRTILWGAAAASLAATTGLIAEHSSLAQPTGPASVRELAPDFRELQSALHDQARQWISADRLLRDDGYLYAVDIGQLMICMAGVQDRESYDLLRKRAIAELIRDDPHEPYMRGMVVWRRKASQKMDASGTTEALRVARGLWMGSKAFGRNEDADLAMVILDGYARHAMVDQGVWIISNYFDFNTHGFANNSFLVDYDADFVSEVAEARKSASLREIAQRSARAVEMAVAPSGLLYDLLQPELKTLYPELDVVAFSPNDIVQFSNCATVATTIARSVPHVARNVLAFALNRIEDLRIYYYGRSGQVVNDRPAGLAELSALARLAMRVGSLDSAAAVATRALPKWKYFAAHAKPSQAYLVSEILLALHELLAP